MTHKEACAKYRAKNKDKLNAQERKRYAKDKKREQERSSNWRANNKEKKREYARKYRANLKQWIEEQIALRGPCAHCGQWGPNLLFHHVDPTTKNFNVSRGMSDKCILLLEMDLCIILCPSCHKIHHNSIRLC